MEAVTHTSAKELASELLGTPWWVDPSQEPSLPIVLPPNPLVILSDNDLVGAMIATRYTCGRAHTAFKKKHRQYICGLHFALKIEKSNRDALKS